MSELTKIEDTLFVPMLGRIYASEKFPELLYDKKALEIKSQLPGSIKGRDTQTQYTLLAGAVRSVNMDTAIQDFVQRHPDGIIAQIGCGLETTYYRNENITNTWYEIDLPEVISYRRQILPENTNEKYISGDAFSEEWMKEVRKISPEVPMLVTASGLFYYFEREKVMDLFRRLKKYGPVEIVFDTVNSKGLKMISHYMRQVGHADATVYFYVDGVREMADAVGAASSEEMAYYAHTPKKGLKWMTSLSMKVADHFRMVKMVHLKMNE